MAIEPTQFRERLLDAQQTTPVALKEFINKITGFTVEDLG